MPLIVFLETLLALIQTKGLNNMKDTSDYFYKTTTKEQMAEIIRQLILITYTDEQGSELSEKGIWEKAIDERDLLIGQGFFNKVGE